MQKLMRKLKEFFQKGDLLLLLLCLVTSVYGIVIIASATNYMGSGGYVLRQLLALLLGIVCYIAFTLLDVDIFAERWHLLFLFNVLFLLLLVPFGIEGTTGNRSWISFPFLPFNIQPAELCKIPFIIILAKTMQTNQRKLSAPRSILQLGFRCWDDRWSNVNRRIREYPCYATANREKCAILR